MRTTVIILSFGIILFAWMDQQYRKTPYQSWPDPFDVPIKSVQGHEVENHGHKIRMLFERNSVTWISIWMSSLCLGRWTGGSCLSYFWITPVSLMLDNVLFAGWGLSFFDTEIAIQRGYEFWDIVLDNNTGHGHDLGFNLWNGTLDKKMSRAQVDKWDHMISELGLQPGDRLMDVGCGYGDWLAYAKSKGMIVTGINLSPDQAYYARMNYDIPVVNDNWKSFLTNTSLQKKYYGTFDAVTFMDTVEHYVSNVKVMQQTLHNLTEETCADAHSTYYDMFEMASKMINKNSSRKKVFISMLHTTEAGRRDALTGSDSFFRLVAIMIMTRTYSGHYPAAFQCHCISGDCRADMNEKPGKYHGLAKYAVRQFNLTRIDDVTEDYRLTAVKNPKHFQSPLIAWTPSKIGRLFIKALLDPYLLWQLIQVRWDVWMRLYGENYTMPTYDPGYRRNHSWQLCYWMTFQLLD